MSSILSFFAWVSLPATIAVSYGLIHEAITTDMQQAAVQRAKDKTTKDQP